MHPARVDPDTGVVAPLERRLALLDRRSLCVPFAHQEVWGPVAQSVEQGTFNPKVAGSIPARPIPDIAQTGGRTGLWAKQTPYFAARISTVRIIGITGEQLRSNLTERLWDLAVQMRLPRIFTLECVEDP